MKKILSVLSSLVLSFSIFVGAVSADHTNHILELVEARNDTGGGVIIIFRFGGTWENSELNTLKQGTVFLGDSKYGLHCKIEDERVICTTSRVVAGSTVRIYIGGFTFYAFIRPSGDVASGDVVSGGNQVCYSIYNLTEAPFFQQAWIDDGVHCQSSTANVDDTIDHNSQLFSFQLSSPTATCIPTPVNDDAYYAFVSC